MVREKENFLLFYLVSCIFVLIIFCSLVLLNWWDWLQFLGFLTGLVFAFNARLKSHWNAFVKSLTLMEVKIKTHFCWRASLILSASLKLGGIFPLLCIKPVVSGFYYYSLLAFLFPNLFVDCSQIFLLLLFSSISRDASIPGCIWNMHVFLSSRQPIGVVNS